MLFNLIGILDRAIGNNFRKCNITPRPTNSNGIWCGFLLPTILLIYMLQCEMFYTYRALAFVLIGQMVYNLLFILYLAYDARILKEPVCSDHLVSLMMAAPILFAFVEEGFYYDYALSVSSIIITYGFTCRGIDQYPRTFTLGELTIVVQCIVMFVAVLLTQGLTTDGENTPDQFVNNVLYCVIVGTGSILLTLHYLSFESRNIKQLKTLLISGIIAYPAALYVGLGDTFAVQCYEFVFQPHRLKLIAFWAALAAAAGAVMWVRVHRGVRADTANRKVFHVLASLVFASGTLLDIELMRLAAGCGLAVLVVLEVLRQFEMPIVSNALEAAFQIYKDERDNGAFAVTPFALYCGLACPLVLVPECGLVEGVAPLAGVLSVGVGDAAASWYGSKYGLFKWAGTEKTLDGTIFNVLAQMAAVAALVGLGLLPWCFKSAFMSALVSAAVEARTEQVDNLVLPLVALLGCQLNSLIPYFVTFLIQKMPAICTLSDNMCYDLEEIYTNI